MRRSKSRCCRQQWAPLWPMLRMVMVGVVVGRQKCMAEGASGRHRLGYRCGVESNHRSPLVYYEGTKYTRENIEKTESTLFKGKSLGAPMKNRNGLALYKRE